MAARAALQRSWRASAVAGPSSYNSVSRSAALLAAPRRRQQSSWAAVVDTAKNLIAPEPATAASHSNPSSSNSSSSSAASSTPPPAPSSTSSTSHFQDPLELVGRELSSLRSNVSALLGSGHPSLDTIAKYYFQAEGKHIRPLIVLLVARATNGLSPMWSQLSVQAGRAGEGGREMEHDMGIDEPLSPREVLNDFNPHMEGVESASFLKSSILGDSTSSSSTTSDLFRQATSSSSTSSSILPTQRRLAEITEMIHVASLLHDDVIDASSLRRGAPSAPAAFGNKLSILGGDFLLGRASVALARLRDNEVVELLATVIANLVEGEVMQLRAQALEDGAQGTGAAARKSAFSTFWEGDPTSSSSSSAAPPASSTSGPTPEIFEAYLQKTYLKTAALIGKSARAATILGGFGADAVRLSGASVQLQEEARAVRDAAYQYGRNLGIAFQLVDDLLDFRSTSAAFGKPSGGADLRLGLATAPVLYAWEELPNEGLGEMVRRKFEGEGDVEKALAIVARSTGLQRTADLARHHCRLASEALLVFPPSEARTALETLNQSVLTRVK